MKIIVDHLPSIPVLVGALFAWAVPFGIRQFVLWLQKE